MIIFELDGLSGIFLPGRLSEGDFSGVKVPRRMYRRKKVLTGDFPEMESSLVIFPLGGLSLDSNLTWMLMLKECS